MNILQLCKAAERYELLCMMNLSESDIIEAADRYMIEFEDLYCFIEAGADTLNDRGLVFADFASHKTDLVNTVLLNSKFYEIWESIING